MAQDCDILVGTSKTQRLEMIDGKAPLLGTHKYGVCWNGGTAYKSGTFYPYRCNILADVVTDTDTNGNVIVTLKNIKLVPSGTNDKYYSTKKYPCPWYGSISSNIPAYRAIAIAVTTTQTVPSNNDSRWHKCLGGWYTAGVTCGTACVEDKWGNRPGGTWGYWNDRDGNGTAFSKAQYQSFARRVPDQTWNLGQVAPTNGDTAKIYIIAHWQMGVGNNLNCNIGMAGNSYVAGMSFDIPVLNLCPPEFDRVEQSDNVCNNCIDVDLCFKASELGGQSSVDLYVEYKYEGQKWDLAEGVTVTAEQNKEVCVKLDCLIPGRKVEWRAQYVLPTGYNAKSDFIDGSFNTLFIPSVGMIVPDISDEECQKISDGLYIEHFKEEVGYYG